MYQTKTDVYNRVLEHTKELKNLGHNYFFVSLQGSWNYDLGYEGSDVDTKALVLPSLRDVVLNKKAISTTHILENNEHLDLKDARVMFDNFWKQNINFLEILFSDYVVVNSVFLDECHALRRMREDIAHYDVARAVNCMCGMAMEKYHALKKPYPATAADIEKYGYSPKEFHHILRMYNFLHNYIHDMSFEECLTAHTLYDKDALMAAKRGLAPLDYAEHTSAFIMDKMKEMKDSFLASHKLEIDMNTRRAAEEILYSVFEKQFRFELN